MSQHSATLRTAACLRRSPTIRAASPAAPHSVLSSTWPSWRTVRSRKGNPPQRATALRVEISMREIAAVAGVSKPLLYHYFPSKSELFKAAVEEKAAELASVIEPSDEGSPVDQLARSLDAYLGWIADNAQTWSKLMQSATTLPEARELVEAFRERTLELVLGEIGRGRKVRPALRTAVTE